MKKIYSGDVLAAAILDNEQEIEAVRTALQYQLDQRPDAGLPIVRELLRELGAKAPA
jgi:hypothetical protein